MKVRNSVYMRPEDKTNGAHSRVDTPLTLVGGYEEVVCDELVLRMMNATQYHVRRWPMLMSKHGFVSSARAAALQTTTQGSTQTRGVLEKLAGAW
jgi:hypothetical protein